MDSLHLSRFTKNQITNKLVNLSPEKYNRSAWADLTYTPSKLTNNVLYRQVTNLKKEEGQLKIRQYQTMNYDFIKQKLIKTQLERDGIYSSLNQQIVMYKKMLHQTQMKHEVRLKQLQIRFDQQISLLIQQKREEVKFILAQKQTFQGRIYELQLQLKQAIERWNSLNSSYKNLEHVHSSLIVISEKYKQLQREKANQQEDALRKQQQLKKNMYKIQQSYAQKIQNLQLQKAKTKQGFERLMKIEIEKIQNVRMNQNYQKGQELRQVLVNFERETKRLNQIILMKDRLIENLNIQNKEKFFKNTQIYQLKIEEQNKNNLILTSQIEQFRRRVFQLQSDIKNQIASRISQKDHFNAHFAKLQEQLQLNKINFVRQRQQISYRSSDLQKQIMRLKSQNMRYSDVLRENEMLSIELRNLRDLLVQSSYQIDRSTQQLHRISFQRDNLALKNQMVMQQQDRMCLLKRSLESQGCCKPKTIQTCRRKCSCKH